MTKDELVRHLRTIHAAKITEPRWTTKAELESAHAEYHVREREARKAIAYLVDSLDGYGNER